MAKLPPENPASARPMKSIQKLVAAAQIRLSMAKVSTEMSRIGRRPKRSDKLPISGAKRNCIAEYISRSQPPSIAAALTSSPVSSCRNAGRTGMIIAIPMTSRNRMTKTRNRPRRTDLGSSIECLSQHLTWKRRSDRRDDYITEKENRNNTGTSQNF
ncbi:hypothetical protein D3C87_1579090 [compost metagenome]